MQNLTGKTQADPYQPANGVEGSPLLTIEYLRASLLAERSVSKAEKERVDELTKRVKELEEQLKFVSIQRKQAEKATLDVLSYLESRGVSDTSEVHESECDLDSVYESNVLKSWEDDNFGSKASKGNGKESSDSEHESSGSLSWNGRKKMSQLLQKRNLESSIRRTNFPVVNYSRRHHLGKSCRQIKPRERLAVEVSRHDSVMFEIQGSNTMDSSECHATLYEKSGSTPERLFEIGRRKEDALFSFHGEPLDGDANSSSQGHEYSGQIERALKHQAELTQFKVPRNWEKKYEDNQVSTVDSCEPGDHSDITEEDENKATTPHFDNAALCYDDDLKDITETHFQSKSGLSHKLTPCAYTGRSDDETFNASESSTSQATDFVFPTVCSNHTKKHEEGNSLHKVHCAAVSEANTLCKSQYANLDERHAVGPKEGLPWPGEVLNALQGAKVLINQKLHRLPESGGSAKREIGSSVSSISDAMGLKIPSPCPGLFRVPTDLPPQTPSYGIPLFSHNSRELTDAYLHARAPYLQDYLYISSPLDSRPNALSLDAISSSSVYVNAFSSASPSTHVAPSKSTISPHSSIPQQMPPNRMLSARLPGTEAGFSPSGSPLFNDDPSMYK